MGWKAFGSNGLARMVIVATETRNNVSSTRAKIEKKRFYFRRFMAMARQTAKTAHNQKRGGDNAVFNIRLFKPHRPADEHYQPSTHNQQPNP